MRPIVVRELVALDCELYRESGETPSREFYLARFANFSEEANAGFEDWLVASNEVETGHKDSATPERLGDYRIIREIGRGGMGVVYEAIQESLDRKVAIKTLANRPLHAPKSAHRFRREVRAIARLHHTNIVQIYGSGFHNGLPYFAMQLIDGQSLDAFIAEARGIKDSEDGPASDLADSCDEPHQLLGKNAFVNVAELGKRVCSALQYAHDNGVLHRDIKPANLMVDKNHGVYVGDFGLAKLRAPGDNTVSGKFLGTVRYSSPETFAGSWCESSDVYSLGLTLYELLALQPAYPEEDHASLIDRITRGEAPVRLRRINSSIPRDLETIVSKAIRREPASRYQTAAELASDLECFCRGLPISARPRSAVEKTVRWIRRKPFPATLLACIATLLLVGLPVVTSMWLRSERALEMARSEAAKARSARAETIFAYDLAKSDRLDAMRASYASDMPVSYTHLTLPTIYSV